MDKVGKVGAWPINETSPEKGDFVWISNGISVRSGQVLIKDGNLLQIGLCADKSVTFWTRCAKLVERAENRDKVRISWKQWDVAV